MRCKTVTKLNELLDSFIARLDNNTGLYDGKAFYTDWTKAKKDFIANEVASAKEVAFRAPIAALVGSMILPSNGRHTSEYARNALKRWKFQIRNWVV